MNTNILDIVPVSAIKEVQKLTPEIEQYLLQRDITVTPVKSVIKL